MHEAVGLSHKTCHKTFSIHTVVRIRLKRLLQKRREGAGATGGAVGAGNHMWSLAQKREDLLPDVSALEPIAWHAGPGTS